MKLCSTLTAFAAVAALSLAGAEALAQGYPNRPITWVVPFTPGGITDSGARIIAKTLSERIGQPVLVENRPGAGGVVGTEFVAKSKPDGYTMVYGTAGTIATNPVLYKTTSFDTRKDLVAVHGMGMSPPVLVANPEKPFKTVAELIDYAKKNPEKVNMASAGAGTTTHLAGELFQQVTGIKFTHVPYKGSIPAMTDVIAGVADVIFDYPVTSMPQEAAGKVRVLAAMTPKRLDVMPKTPSIAELGYPDAEISSWSGIFVAKDTPPDVVARTRRGIRQGARGSGRGQVLCRQRAGSSERLDKGQIRPLHRQGNDEVEEADRSVGRESVLNVKKKRYRLLQNTDRQ